MNSKEYARLADREIKSSDYFASENMPNKAESCLAKAQVYASLAIAASFREYSMRVPGVDVLHEEPVIKSRKD